MAELTPSDKAKLQVASICRAYCERFRLLRVDSAAIDVDDLLRIGTDVLDLFEHRLQSAEVVGKAARKAASAPEGQQSKAEKNLPRSFPSLGERS